MKNDEKMMNTLFLDRDGIINVQIVGGYVRKPEEFQLIPGVLTAMQWLRPKFLILSWSPTSSVWPSVLQDGRY